MRPLEPRVLRLLPSARRGVATLGALGVVSGMFAIAQAFTLSTLVVATVRGHGVADPALWTAGVLVARGVAAAMTQLVADRAGADTACQVRRLAVHRWLQQPADDRPRSAEMLSGATSGASSVEPYVARYLPALVSAAILPPVAILALLLTDWPSALIVVLTVPLLPLFAALIGKHTQVATQQRWRALTVLAGHFLDVARGLPTLVGYQRAEAQVGVVEEVGGRHRRATVRTLRIAFLSSAALELLATISVAMVAVWVGLRLAYGTMSLQVALTAILLTPEAYWPIRRVGQEFHAAADGALALHELLPPEESQITPERSHTTLEESHIASEWSHTPGEARPIADSTGGIPTDATLTYRYPEADRETLHGLHVPLRRGLTVLVGSSGCGKTTALELLAGLRIAPGEIDRGPTVRFPVKGAATAKPTDRNNKIHLVTQRPFLAPMSVRDNLVLGAGDVTDLELQHALQVTGFDRVLRDLGMRRGPESPVASDRSIALSDSSRVGSDLSGGMGVVLGDEGFGLSAGQRSLVALTRAVLSGAPVLLLDEPTAHLDDTVAAHLRGVIARLAEDRAVIIATHDHALIDAADRVVSLDAVAA